MPDNITTEQRKEFARIRSLMVSPGSVNLLHSDQAIWLADKYVLLDVSDSPAVAGLSEGTYRLTANKGPVKVSDMIIVKLPEYLTYVHRFSMYPAFATEWSITDSAAKAMLFYAEVSIPGVSILRGRPRSLCVRYPLAMNYELWQAFLRSYPDARLSHSGHAGPFLVSTESKRELAYISTIQIPAELQEQATAIIDIQDREKNHERHQPDLFTSIQLWAKARLLSQDA